MIDIAERIEQAKSRAEETICGFKKPSQACARDVLWLIRVIEMKDKIIASRSETIERENQHMQDILRRMFGGGE